MGPAERRDMHKQVQRRIEVRELAFADCVSEFFRIPVDNAASDVHFTFDFVAKYAASRSFASRAWRRAAHLERPGHACRRQEPAAVRPSGRTQGTSQMRFTGLQVTDFRATRQLEIGFERDVTVIVGRNGAGKTSILDALCMTISCLRHALGKALRPDEDRSAPSVPYSRLDFRNGAASLGIRLTFDMSDELKECRPESTRGEVRVSIDRLEVGTVSSVGTPSGLFDEWSRTDAPKPRFVYFRQERGFASADAIGSGNEGARLLDPEAVQDSSLERDLRAIVDLEAWWDRHDAQEARRVRDGDAGHRSPQLQAIRRLVAKMDGFSGVAFESAARPPGLHFVKDDGTRVHVHALSSGERSFIVLLADLARRLQVFAPDRPLEEISATVLIDEIELNLHPAWQSRIVPMLSEAFASCQFIVTTHSPQVLSGVESRQVRIVEVDESDGSSKVTVPRSTRGRTSNYLLEGVLGASERFPPIDAEIESFNAAIDDGDSDAAADRLAAIEREIGADAATLLVLHKRLKTLRAAG